MKNAELLRMLSDYDEIVIFGAANIGLYLYDFLKESKVDSILVICDNSHKKQESMGVLSVDQATSLYKNAVYLLTNSVHENTMKSQLLDMNISRDQIVFAVTEESLEYDRTLNAKKKLSPLNKLQFEVDIAAHCNLNCKCCSQFSCIADEEFIDLHNMEQDFERLGELFDGEAEKIYLIGGEPLLHPDIISCMQSARKYFRIGKISVFTNGLLLLSREEEFWETCREYDITLIVTKYPIDLNYEGILQKVKEENVVFEFFTTSEDYKYMTNLGLDIDGRQNIQKSFINCTEANNCIKLRQGKLYTCTRPAAIYKFNKYFKLDLEVSEKDYINIYQEKNGQEILRKLSKPIPFCKYCNPTGERKAMIWGKTEKKIQEWL